MSNFSAATVQRLRPAVSNRADIFSWRGLFLLYQNLHLHRAVLRHRKSLLEIPIFPFAECTPYAHPQVSVCRVQGVIHLYAPWTGLFLCTLQTAENKKAARKPCYQDLLTTTVCKIKTPALYQYLRSYMAEKGGFEPPRRLPDLHP